MRSLNTLGLAIRVGVRADGLPDAPSATHLPCRAAFALPAKACRRPDCRSTATRNWRAVRISDVSRMDVAAPVIAEIEIATEGRQVPLAFALNYNAARIDPRGRYAVSARITEGGGRLIWITDTHVDLPPPGQPIELAVVRVPSEPLGRQPR